MDLQLCNLGSFLRVANTVDPGATGCPSVTNKGVSRCLDRFYFNPTDPITRWINLQGVYTGNPASPCQSDGSNSYPQGDVELTLFDAWTVDIMRISCIDAQAHIVYLTSTTQAGNYPYFGPVVGHRYVIDNTLDAFNAANAGGQTGIWFLDRSTSPWILNYLAKTGENPNADTISLRVVCTWMT